MFGSWRRTVLQTAGAPRSGTARARAVACELFLALTLLLVLPAVANATAITEFPLPAGATPGPPTAGPDGNVWFTVGGSDPGSTGSLRPATSPTTRPAREAPRMTLRSAPTATSGPAIQETMRSGGSRPPVR